MPDIVFPQELYDAVNPPAGGLTPQQMLDLDLAHARRFIAGDHEAIRKLSFIETPVYEWFPQGVRLTGLDAVRAMHETSVKRDPASWPPQIRSVAFGHNVMMLETSRMHTLPDGTRKRCHMVAVIPFEGERLVGERVYTDRHLASMKDQAMPDGFLERPDVEIL